MRTRLLGAALTAGLVTLPAGSLLAQQNHVPSLAEEESQMPYQETAPPPLLFPPRAQVRTRQPATQSGQQSSNSQAAAPTQQAVTPAPRARPKTAAIAPAEEPTPLPPKPPQAAAAPAQHAKPLSHARKQAAAQEPQPDQLAIAAPEQRQTYTSHPLNRNTAISALPPSARVNAADRTGDQSADQSPLAPLTQLFSSLAPQATQSPQGAAPEPAQAAAQDTPGNATDQDGPSPLAQLFAALVPQPATADTTQAAVQPAENVPPPMPASGRNRRGTMQTAAAEPPAQSFPTPATAAGLHTVACRGVFAKDSGNLALAMAFDSRNVIFTDVDGGTAGRVPASVVFPNDPKRRLEVWWTNPASRTDIDLIVIGGRSDWAAPGGLHLGLTVAQLEQLNHKPFKLKGFDQNNIAAVSDWDGGALAALPSGCKAGVSLRADPRAAADALSAFTADNEYSSSDPAIRALKPTVSEILIGY